MDPASTASTGEVLPGCGVPAVGDGGSLGASAGAICEVMQEIYESLILLDFPVPKPNLICRLELEEELGVPDPNDSKEWETLRVAPADDGTGSEEEEEEEAPEPDGTELVELDLVLAQGAQEGVPQSPLLGASYPSPWHPSEERPARRARRGGGGRGGGQRGRRGGSCGQCPGGFSRRLQGTEKPFKCLDCGKGFTRSSNRNAHQRTHRGQLPPHGHGRGHGCGHGSGHGSGYGSEPPEHRRRLLLHAGELPPGAGRGWGPEPGVQQRLLGGERPSRRCPRRGGGFERGPKRSSGPRRPPLRQRPYECGHCGRGFSYSSAFLKHQRSHGADPQPPPGSPLPAEPVRARSRRGAPRAPCPLSRCGRGPAGEPPEPPAR